MEKPRKMYNKIIALVLAVIYATYTSCASAASWIADNVNSTFSWAQADSESVLAWPAGYIIIGILWVVIVIIIVKLIGAIISAAKSFGGR